MYYKITKLDGRFAGYQQFAYRIEFVSLKGIHPWGPLINPIYNDFCIARNWCTETFGFSCERDMLQHIESANLAWAWHVNLHSKDLYIYLQSDKELSFLQLKFHVDGK